MAMLNIPSTRDDPNYRYKMPKLMSKIEGRGNGIKTNIMNMGDIARALKRPPEYCTKFCGHELGAPAKFEKDEGKSIVNGAHEPRDLQTLIDKFIEKYVLCPGCNLPEIDIVVDKKSRVLCHCNACGHSGDLDNTHKLATFILKNPPCGNSTMGKKDKGSSKTERRERKKAAGGHEDSVEGTEGADAAKKKKSKSSKKTDEAEAGDADGSVPAEKPLKDKSKKKKKKKEKTGMKDLLLKERLTFQSHEVADVISQLLGFMEVSATNGSAITPDDFFSELRVLQVAQDFDASVRLFVGCTVLFGESEPVTADLVEEKMPFIRKLVDDSLTTPKACSALESFVDLKSPKSVDNFGFILHKFFVHDLLDDEALLDRYGGTGCATDLSPGFEKARAAAQPFIEWLAEEGETGSEDEAECTDENENSKQTTGGKGSTDQHSSSPDKAPDSMKIGNFQDEVDDDFDIEDI